ncbi:MAG: DUF5058 family protein [Peptoniphilaceae bacterium]|uniref:DUF5058 family protein n=1 Tax=Parvimonas sp. TaxID=1944660 RepID=UPI0025F5B8B4|nr:DUF5058 family protein [Parvimonas sp.]MCI5997422.1 DUF5058 family protein [Parvimonas sp.]MDD7765491.1 DUF5058 family protein [Peptoniphilaceae bacterium]MDY3051032.1 DUF5058 family protein [Parvimonas sp.]
MDYLKYANSYAMWLLAIPVAVICGVQAYIFYKKAMKSAPLVELSKEDAKKAFRVGAFSAIGPAFGVFVVMLGLMGAIGGPLAWMRLSVIGAAPTELAAANMAASAMGTTLGANNYSLVHFANAAWVMALNGSAWLLTTGLFTHKLDKINKKISGGNPKKMAKITLPAMCGAFAFFFSKDLLNGLKPEMRGFMISGITAAISMIILEKIAKKYPKLVEYNLGIAMVIGMTATVLYIKLGGI